MIPTSNLFENFEFKHINDSNSKFISKHLSSIFGMIINLIQFFSIFKY
jgi:hypothetical protein